MRQDHGAVFAVPPIHHCTRLVESFGTTERELTHGARVERLTHWARHAGVILPSSLIPVLALCDSASEVRVALALCDRPGWTVTDVNTLSSDELQVTVQVPIGRYRGDCLLTSPFAGDRIILEIDGPTHYTARGREKDSYRDDELSRAGYRVIRVWAGSAIELARQIDRAVNTRRGDQTIHVVARGRCVADLSTTERMHSSE